MMKRRSYAVLGTALVCAVPLLVSCSSGGGSGDDASSSISCPTDWDETVEAAKQEGALTWYTSVPAEPAEGIATAFHEEYGIAVATLKLPSSNLLQRYAAEAQSGRIGADVLSAGDAEAFATNEAAEAGWVAPLEDLELPNLPNLPEQFVREYSATIQTQPWLLSYNTDLVSEAPTSWEDLNSPEYANTTFLLPDPSSSAAYIEFWDFVEAQYGADFITEFVESHDIRVYSSGGAVMEALAAGEGGFRVPSTASSANGVIEAGAPVANTLPALTTGVEIQTSVTACGKSEASNAARVFVNYLLSEEGSALLAELSGDISPFDTTGLPADYEAPRPGASERTDEILAMLEIN